MTRPDWVNLNGWWEYAILPKSAPAPQTFDGKILVPYPVESLLSGVQKSLLPDQLLWYQRTFSNPAGQGQRVLLHFGAVDHQCHIWLNGRSIGTHQGGYLPFTFDITDALKEAGNKLTLSVWDPTDTGMQQRGKQVLQPNGIWYTPISGIWQTVWLEIVPEVSIELLKLTPDLDDQSLLVEVKDQRRRERRSGGSGGILRWRKGLPGKSPRGQALAAQDTESTQVESCRSTPP